MAVKPTAPVKAPRLVLLGPPGAGKGTLAENLRKLPAEHLSSGELFRQQIRAESTLGQRLQKELEGGSLVSDELTLEIMRKWFFSRPQRKGFLLDGFPRTLPQARAFDEWLEARGQMLDAAILLQLSEEEAVERIAHRRVCPKDGKVFHLRFNPPAREGICDLCGTPLEQREDDREPIVRERFRIYYRSTAPVISYYREQGLLMEISSQGHARDLAGQVMKDLLAHLAEQ